MFSCPLTSTPFHVGTVGYHTDCAFNFGDIQAFNFDLRVFATGSLAIAIAMWAIAGISLFVAMTLIKSRHVRIIGDLEESAVKGDDAKPPEPGKNDVVENPMRGMARRGSLTGMTRRESLSRIPEGVDNMEPISEDSSENAGVAKKTAPKESISEVLEYFEREVMPGAENASKALKVPGTPPSTASNETAAAPRLG